MHNIIGYGLKSTSKDFIYDNDVSLAALASHTCSLYQQHGAFIFSYIAIMYAIEINHQRKSLPLKIIIHCKIISWHKVNKIFSYFDFFHLNKESEMIESVCTWLEQRI